MATFKLATFAVIFTLSSLHASLIDQRQNDQDLLAAEWILQGTTVASDTQADGKFDLKYEVKIRVDHIEKNSATKPLSVGDEIFISGLGGERNGVGLIYEGYPRPRKNQSYRFYLASDGSDFRIVGHGAGMRNLRAQRQYSRNRTDGVNGQGDGEFIHWGDNTFPVPYSISSVTFQNHPSFPAAIDASFKTWRDVMNTRVEFLPQGCSTLQKSQNDGLNNIVYIEDSWPFDSSVIALTRTYYVSSESPNEGEILDADILLNGVDHRFTTTGEAGHHDIQNVLTHEIGHLLGFGHEISPIDPDATMYAFAVPGETNKRALHTNELNGLIDAYGGAGTKLQFTGPFCQISQATGSSCLATHAPVTPGQLWLFLTFTLAMVATPIAMRRYWF